ncbi:MAG: hypothetical protein G01um101425_254 [Candidatus Peregrinibacteria bacterium Gr01-1014_25]|nr:MAG: hypothetical protein G01um101425_254 [Candidatus Peregrinibacteria bacterium Gr01-1014_25]
MTNQPLVPPVWKNIELCLLFVTVFAKTILFVSRLDVPWGYDVPSYFQAMAAVDWLHPFFDLRAFYYAMHPPLAFLLADTVAWITGSSPLEAVQTVSFIASLEILFLLRATLGRLHLLDHPCAIAFLYVTCNLPLQSYLLVGVNMDVLVFVWACAALYQVVTLVQADHRRVVCASSLLGGYFLAAGCLTKFSGIVSLAIPFLYAITAGKNVALNIKRGLVMVAVAMTLVMPYYFVNYYIPEGTFFYTSAGTMLLHESQPSIAERNADPLGFIVSFVHVPKHEGRLVRTWWGLWRGEGHAPQSPAAQSFSNVYLALMPWLVLMGIAIYLLRRRPRDEWHFFSRFIVRFSLLQLLFLIAVITKYPVPGLGHHKVIYIAAASMGIGVFLSMWMYLPQMLRNLSAASREKLTLALFALIFLFVIANNVIPVY